MKNILIIIFFFTLFSCKKRNKEGWIVFLKEKIENTNWETGYPNEKLIFKNDTLKFYKNDSIINLKYYNLQGKPALGLMGYGKDFNIYFDKKIKRHSVRFYQDYKMLTISYDGINSFLLSNDKRKSEMDSTVLSGFIKKGVSSRISIKQIDSILSIKK